jgi:hypothetical protein
MNTIETKSEDVSNLMEPADKVESVVADSLDIDDPELIKFMNTKMNIETESVLDLFCDVAYFAFENIVVTPCKYIRDYMVNFDFTQFLSKDFWDKCRTTLFLSGPVMNEQQSTVTSLPSIPEETEEVEPDHVFVENNEKTEN